MCFRRLCSVGSMVSFVGCIVTSCMFSPGSIQLSNDVDEHQSGAVATRDQPNTEVPTTSADEQEIRFGRKLTSEEIETIVSDDKPHPLLVLFQDHVQIRVKHNEGSIRGLKDDNGFWAPTEQQHLLRQLEEVLLGFNFIYIRSLDTPMLKEETRLLSKSTTELTSSLLLATGRPRGDLYSILEMSEYNKNDIKLLALEIQDLDFVKEISVLGTVHTPKARIH